MGPGPVWTGKNSCPHRASIPDRPARSSVAIPTELPGPPRKNMLPLYTANCSIRLPCQEYFSAIFISSYGQTGYLAHGFFLLTDSIYSRLYDTCHKPTRATPYISLAI